MQYQTFRGSDVREALAHVRAAFGADALIESTRHISNGHDGVLGNSFVEIVAAPAALGQRSSRSGATRSERKPESKASANGLSAASEAWLRDSPKTRVGTSIRRAMHNGKLDPMRVERELEQLRMIVEELEAGRPPRDRAYALLAAAGFDGKLARLLAHGSSRATRGGNESLRDWLAERVSQRLMFQSGLVSRPYRQIIACVGPTGVGKTTTLAKIAAHAAFDHGRSVSVISLDTFRVGAGEQWNRYAELLDVPFSVATDEDAFQELVHADATDIVLVDTPGHSVHDAATGTGLADCLAPMASIRSEVLLVLPAWLRARDAEALYQAHSNPRPTGLVLTKMDETRQIGGALHAALTENLPLTYLCNGARVPEDLHDASLNLIINELFPEHA